MTEVMLQCNRNVGGAVAPSYPSQFAVAPQNQIRPVQLRGHIMKSFRLVLFVFVTFALAACQTAQPSLNMSVGAIKIESIKVSIETAIPPDSDVAQRLLAFATYRLQKQSAPAGKQINVAIQITQFHRKNPVASLLIGDSNRMGALVTLSDSKGAVLSRQELFAANSMAINGVIGAVAAAASEATETDDALADDLASRIERSIFGRALVGQVQVPRTMAPPPAGARAAAGGIIVR
jgi:hypothetical protein